MHKDQPPSDFCAHKGLKKYLFSNLYIYSLIIHLRILTGLHYITRYSFRRVWFRHKIRFRFRARMRFSFRIRIRVRSRIGCSQDQTTWAGGVSGSSPLSKKYYSGTSPQTGWFSGTSYQIDKNIKISKSNI